MTFGQLYTLIAMFMFWLTINPRTAPSVCEAFGVPPLLFVAGAAFVSLVWPLTFLVVAYRAVR